MDHAEAMDTGAAERYALGQMEEGERDRYEEHFFDCPECAAEVKAAVSFLDNAETVVREKARVAPGPDEHAPPHTEPWWAGLRALFWPLPYGAAAAAALLVGVVGYQSLLVVPGLKQALGEARSLRSAPSYFLTISRGEGPVVTTSERERTVVLTLSRSSDRTFPFYLCEVREARGRTVLSNVVPAPPPQDELQILLPTETLRPGAYVVVVAGLESVSAPASTSSEAAQYHFTLRRGEREEGR
jgi:hypothetical protein